MPVTSCPAASRRGTSGRPTAPLAPATKTLMRAASPSRRSIQASSRVTSTSETKLNGPSHDGSASPMSIGG